MKTKKIYIPAETNEAGEIIKKESYKEVDIKIPTKLVNGKRFILSEKEIIQFEKDRKPSLNHLKQKKKQELKSIRDSYKIEHGYFNERKNNNKILKLNGHTEEESQQCRNFFDDLILKYNDFKDEIIGATSEEELNNFNITFEE